MPKSQDPTQANPVLVTLVMQTYLATVGVEFDGYL